MSDTNYKLDTNSQLQNYEAVFNESRKLVYDDDELTSEEYQQFSRILQSINRNLQSGKKEWIEKSIYKLLELTRQKNASLNTLIVNSDAFSTLCTNYSSVYTLFILRISLNLTAKNPCTVYILINSNIISTVFEYLKSTEDQDVLTCLKIITNLINSSYFSRICLVASGFFQCALNFLLSPNKLDHLHHMGKLVEYIIACFFDPSISSNFNSAESQSLGLNDPLIIPQLLDQTYKQLRSEDRNTTFNLKAAKKILSNKNGLNLDTRDPLWDVLMCMISKPDGYLIAGGLASLRRFSRSPSNTMVIFHNTSLFDECKKICSRNNNAAIDNLLCLLSQFLFVVGKEANREFIRNGLFEVVVNYFNYPDKAVKVSAMKCISNCLCYESNLNLINDLFTIELVNDMIRSAHYDNLSLSEKEEILFILVNLAEINPQIRLLLFASEANMELMIDFLNLSSKIVFIMLDVLSKLIDSQNNYEIDILYMFIQCNGAETIENLMNHQLDHIAQSAQVFYDRYLNGV